MPTLSTPAAPCFLRMRLALAAGGEFLAIAHDQISSSSQYWLKSKSLISPDGLNGSHGSPRS